MPRASRKPVNKKIREELKDHFTSLVSSLRDAKDIDEFFKDFLTNEEKMMLAKRLMLHMMLENGYRISQIETVLGMSRETVRVHKHIWERGGTAYKKVIRKIASREKAKRFWEKVEKVLRPVDLIMRSKTDMRARAKLASGQWYN